MSFLGKLYTLEKQENFEDFLKALGTEVTDDYRKKMLAEKPTNKLSKSGDTYTLSSAGGQETKFKDGVEFDEIVTGKPAKTTITIDGNTVTQVQKFGNAATLTIKREFKGDDMVTTITSSNWDGVAYRYYKA